jgi:hypothetical protein
MPALTWSAALGFALLLLPLGCSSSSGSAGAGPLPRGAATPGGHLAAGWSLHRDAAAGFAVAFPDAWVEATSDSPNLNRDLGTIASQHADLGPFFSDAFASSRATGLALLAADPATMASGFTTNASVFRIDLGAAARAPDLEAVTEGKLAALRKDTSITGGIERSGTTLGGREASKIAYIFKSPSTTVEVASYLLVADVGGKRLEYELTVGSAVADYASLFAAVAASFELTGGKILGTPSPATNLIPAKPGPLTPSP